MGASTVPVHKDGLVITANQVSLRFLHSKEDCKDQETINQVHVFQKGSLLMFKTLFYKLKLVYNVLEESIKQAHEKFQRSEL